MTDKRRTAYEVADDFCEGKFNHRGGYRFTVSELAKALEDYRNEGIEEAANVCSEMEKKAKAHPMFPAYNTNQMALDAKTLGEKIKALKRCGR